MKAFFAGIMGAVIAGLILFFAQNWWSSQQTNANQRVQFDNKAEVVLKKDQVQNLLNKMDYQDLVIQVVSVSNVGQDDIADRSFSDATDYVWGYDNISSPNGNPKNAILTYDGKVLTVRYRLLPAGAKHTFWIASPSFAMSPNFSNDNTGVHVVTDFDKIDDNPFPWVFFGGIGILLVGLVLGGAMSQAIAGQELAKRGYNYKALLASQIKTTDSAGDQSE